MAYILNTTIELLSWSLGDRCSGNSDGGGVFSGLFGGWSVSSSTADDATTAVNVDQHAGGHGTSHDIESHPIERLEDTFGDEDSTGASHSGHDTGSDNSSWDIVDHSTHNDTSSSDTSSWDAGSFGGDSGGGDVGGGDVGFDAGADFGGDMGGDMGGGFGGDMGF